MTGPLDGVLVADFTRLLAGPHATMLLADLGADVIKVESPAGDDARSWGPPFMANGTSVYFHAANRNKRSVVLDLRSKDGRDAARALARRANVVVHNFRPGAAEEFGLGYDQLAGDSPGLVHCAISGFGPQAGANAIGNDFLLQAVGGLLSVTGPEDGPGVKVGIPVVDIFTGCYAAIGILAAWGHRQRTGRGQRVEVDLLSSLLAGLANQAANHLNAGLTGRAMGTEHPSIAPYASYRASDRELAVAVTSDRQFAALAGALGLAELAADPRFASNADRVRNRAELRAVLEATLGTDTAAGWLPRLREAGVPAGPVQTIPEAFALAHDAGLLPEVRLPAGEGATVASVANPVRLSSTPPAYRTAAPGLGEHTEQVLRMLGLPPTGG